MNNFNEDGSSIQLSQEEANKLLVSEGFVEYPAQFGNEDDRTSRFYEKGDRKLMVVSYEEEAGITWVYAG